MALNTNDELNILASVGANDTANTKRRGQPFNEYFGVMPISKDRLERRIGLANDLLEVMFFYYALLEQNPSRSLAQNQLYSEILSAVVRQGELDRYVDELAYSLATDINDTTYKNIKTSSLTNLEGEGDYYTSIDRAYFCAEDMSQSFVNYFEYVEHDGSNKTWRSKEDLVVRPTHEAVNRTTLPFDGIFQVGKSQMRFPKDTSLGASPEEIINCRCWLEYE